MSTLPHYPPSIHCFGWGWNQSALQDHTGAWWIATGEGLCRFPRVASTRQLAYTPPKAVYTMKDGLGGNDVFRVFEEARGDIWVSTSSPSSLSRWDRPTASIHPYSEADCPGLTTAFAEDRHGNLWIGFSNDASRRKPSGLLRYRNGRFQKFERADGIPSGWIHALFGDRSGRLWVGSADGGLGRVDDPAAERLKFITYTTAQGLFSTTIRCITADWWGRIYVGAGRGVDRLDPVRGRFRHYATADGL